MAYIFLRVGIRRGQIFNFYHYCQNKWEYAGKPSTTTSTTIVTDHYKHCYISIIMIYDHCHHHLHEQQQLGLYFYIIVIIISLFEGWGCWQCLSLEAQTMERAPGTNQPFMNPKRWSSWRWGLQYWFDYSFSLLLSREFKDWHLQWGNDNSVTVGRILMILFGRPPWNFNSDKMMKTQPFSTSASVWGQKWHYTYSTVWPILAQISFGFCVWKHLKLSGMQQW